MPHEVSQAAPASMKKKDFSRGESRLCKEISGEELSNEGTKHSPEVGGGRRGQAASLES